MGDFLFSVSCVSCSRRYSGDSSLPPPFLSSPLPFSLFPSSRFCPRCPVRATSVSASPSFDISYFVISAFSVVLCARVLRAHLSLRLSLRPFLRHCMPASSVSIPPDVIRHVLCPLCRMSSGLGRFTCGAPLPYICLFRHKVAYFS